MGTASITDFTFGDRNITSNYKWQAKKKSTNARLVVKQTQCENVRTGNDALREAKTLQVL